MRYDITECTVCYDKWQWREVWPSMVTHTRNLFSAFNSSKCTHSSEHTHHEHTPGAVGSQCRGAWGAVGGSVPCSRVSHQSWYWGGESAGYSLPIPTIPAGPETRTRDLRVTSPTPYLLGQDCHLIYLINPQHRFNLHPHPIGDSVFISRHKRWMSCVRVGQTESRICRYITVAMERILCWAGWGSPTLFPFTNLIHLITSCITIGQFAVVFYT